MPTSLPQLMLLLVCICCSTLVWGQDLYLELARQYSPTVIQGLGSNPEADEFTRVDFDGDWDPDNNWENMPKFKKPPTVYWHVTESSRFFFITYAFFYPRDYAGWCFWVHCHENDFEGMRVTVEKPDRVVKLEALAHNFKSEITNPPRIEVVIEKEGHGIHPMGLRAPDSKHRIYRPSDYALRSLYDLWENRHTLFRDSFSYKGKTYPKQFGGKKWILFGLGAAKPPWAWEVWGSDIQKGEWFLDPLKGSEEKYLSPPLISDTESTEERGPATVYPR
jgi:hypothetical protein